VISRIKAPVYLRLNPMKEQHLRHQPCIREITLESLREEEEPLTSDYTHTHTQTLTLTLTQNCF